MARILVFGGSISAGYYDYKMGGWVNRLKVFFFNKDNEIAVYNRCVSGDSTDDIVKRVKTDLESIEPEVVIFHLGTNDSRHTTTTNDYFVPPERFEKNVASLIKLAKKHTDKLLFAEILRVDESKVCPIPWHRTEYYYNKNIREYNAIIHRIAKKNNIPVILIYDKLTNSMLDDGLHPNSKGHQRIFEIVKEFLIKNKIVM